MVTENDYNTCDYNEFVKMIENIQNGKQEAYKNIIESINNKYLDITENIIKINGERMEILNKMKFMNSKYKHLIGEGEIINSVDIDNNSDEEEDKIIVEPKTGVRGRKKKSETEKPAKKSEEPELEPAKIEEPVGELKKNKVKKTTKKEEVNEVKDVKEVKDLKDVKEIKKVKEEIAEEEEVVEKVKGKKGKKK